jgi:hypothetical protein
MRKILDTLVILMALYILGTHVVQAQSGNVVWLTASPGTTLAANCATTPTLPSVCLVANGLYAWQNSTTGWFLVSPAGAVTGVVKEVQGIAPGTTGNVSLKCTVAIPVTPIGFVAGTSGASISASAPTQTVTATCTGAGS